MAETEALLAGMQAKAASLARLGYRVRFDLSDSGESILVDGTPGGGIEACAPDTPADTVLALTSDNLAKLVAGKLSPMLAFSTGRLKVEGSKGVAMKLASLLDED